MDLGDSGVTHESGKPLGPLDGLVVADFSRVLAGPYCTMLLADMGAEVIKVENGNGDDTRSWVPPTRHGVSTYYLSVNRNKRSISLDLKDSEDLKLAKKLVGRSDVMIENFKPGGLAKYGLDYESVSASNPRIIYASISGFGSSEKASSLPGYDLMVQAISGMMSLTGDPEGPPFRAGVAVFDVMAGLHATIGILAALSNRHQTHSGQQIEINLLSSALSGLVNQTASYVAGEVVPYRMGNAHPSLFPYEPLQTGDGELIIIAGNDGQFKNLVSQLGLEELSNDPRFAHNQDRTANREILRPILLEQLKLKGAEEWFEILIKAGVACAPINTVDKGIEFAKSISLDPVVNVGEGDKVVPLIKNPIKFSQTPVSYRLAPPSVNQNQDEIRKWLLEL